MIVVGDRFEFLRNAGNAGADHFHGQIARSDPDVECQTDGGGTNRRQQGVGNGVGKDAPRFFFSTQCRQGSNDG